MSHWPQHNLIRLPSKLSSELSAYVYAGLSPLPPLTHRPTPLIVCVNPIGANQEAWVEVVGAFRKRNTEAWVLRYDRFGQGESVDPSQGNGGEGGKKRLIGVREAAEDLRGVLCDIVGNEAGREDEQEVEALLAAVPIVLVSNGWGCAVARVYHALYPPTPRGGVRAHLFLDAVVTDLDVRRLLPEGMKEMGEEVERRLEKGAEREGAERGSARRELPRGGGPALEGAPWVTVMEHDPAVFADALGLDPAVTLEYIQPAWHRYQAELTKLTVPGKAKGPIVVEGAGGFIHVDGPEVVAGELDEMERKVVAELVDADEEYEDEDEEDME